MCPWSSWKKTDHVARGHVLNNKRPWNKIKQPFMLACSLFSLLEKKQSPCHSDWTDTDAFEARGPPCNVLGKNFPIDFLLLWSCLRSPLLGSPVMWPIFLRIELWQPQEPNTWWPSPRSSRTRKPCSAKPWKGVSHWKWVRNNYFNFRYRSKKKQQKNTRKQ